MVAHSSHEIFRIWVKICKKNASNFSPRFHLHCCSQVAYISTLISDQSVYYLLLKSLLFIDKRKLHVKIVVPKLQNLIFPVTKRVVLLVHCNVSNVPISQQNPKMIGFTTLLRSTALQYFMSPSIVNFVTKSFQDLTLYVNIETLNTECNSNQEQEMWMWNI